MLHQPDGELLLQARQALGAVAQQCPHHLGNRSPRHQQPHHIGAPVHAATGGQIHRLAAVQQGDPAQGQAQVVGGGKQQVGPHLHRLDVDIGLVEAVEQHQPIGACCSQTLSHGAEVGEEGAQLHGQGQAHLGAHLAHDLLQLGFDGGTGELRVGGNGVDVEL